MGEMAGLHCGVSTIASTSSNSFCRAFAKAEEAANRASAPVVVATTPPVIEFLVSRLGRDDLDPGRRRLQPPEPEGPATRLVDNQFTSIPGNENLRPETFGPKDLTPSTTVKSFERKRPVRGSAQSVYGPRTARYR